MTAGGSFRAAPKLLISGAGFHRSGAPIRIGARTRHGRFSDRVIRLLPLSLPYVATEICSAMWSEATQRGFARSAIGFDLIGSRGAKRDPH